MSVAAQTSGFLEQLETSLVRETDPSRRAEALLLALSAAIKAASNDQNVQRLSRELRAAAPQLSVAVVKPV